MKLGDRLRRLDNAVLGDNRTPTWTEPVGPLVYIGDVLEATLPMLTLVAALGGALAVAAFAVPFGSRLSEGWTYVACLVAASLGNGLADTREGGLLYGGVGQAGSDWAIRGLEHAPIVAARVVVPNSAEVARGKAVKRALLSALVTLGLAVSLPWAGAAAAAGLLIGTLGGLRRNSLLMEAERDAAARLTMPLKPRGFRARGPGYYRVEQS